MQAQGTGIRSASLGPVVAVDDLRRVQAAVEEVYIDQIIQRWLIELVRRHPRAARRRDRRLGEGLLALEQAARAWALLHGRSHVEPEDVERLFGPVLAHRVLLDPYNLDGDASAEQNLVERCLQLAPRPGVALAAD